MKILTIVFSLLISFNALALEGASSSTGVPNPAAVFCIDELEGVYTIADGKCTLGQWALVRKYKAAGFDPWERITGEIDGQGFYMPNPASVFCHVIGGETDLTRGLCKVGAWKVFREFHI